MIAYLFSSAGKETPENNKFSKALCINMYGGKPLNVGQCQDIVQEIKKVSHVFNKEVSIV